jgi:hypothetical protein
LIVIYGEASFQSTHFELFPVPVPEPHEFLASSSWVDASFLKADIFTCSDGRLGTHVRRGKIAAYSRHLLSGNNENNLSS